MSRQDCFERNRHPTRHFLALLNEERMLRRSFLKSVAGLFVLPAVPVAKAFSGAITGSASGSFSSVPTVTIGLSNERIRQLIDDGWRFEVEERSYDIEGVTVRVVSSTGELGAEYTNSIYPLWPKAQNYLQAVAFGPSPELFPYDLLVDVS